MCESFIAPTRLFSTQKVAAVITDSRLVEASGLDQSYTNPGYFWTHNDSGGEPKLYLIDTKGHIQMEVELEGVANMDWEEIVTVQDGDKSYIYVAEIGDNKAVRDDISIIRLEEPKKIHNAVLTIKNENLTIMPLQYAEGARDAEALMFDRVSEEFVLITKREENSLIYSFPFQPGSERITIKSKGTIPTRLFTAADMNEQGEILLKHYDAIYFWGASQEPAVDRILAWNPISIDYSPEPQGEAICWYQKNFYTLSEKNVGKRQEMLFFERLR
ncbi:hypothetical protein SAMN05421640_1694 [Ekhidna lutea]|uniref:Uncharacterized protein n=1 Tax=Ekhidna lutea TaxID=447679 RepID=A0A239IJ97_EKHLU|nr:hypothetical protein [Ekhidna lutea]SNS93720.1 hypothetical protein SAMN05421640_1694 [Ekhidna lutea]